MTRDQEAILALTGRVAELEGECAALRIEADAAFLYGQTGRAHGFVGIPKWSELAEETRSLYREAILRKDKP
jgi:hypothetical protein